MRPNRVDGATDDILPLTKPRIDDHHLGDRRDHHVTLHRRPTACAAQAMPTVEDNNTRPATRSYWHINGAKDADPRLVPQVPVLAVTIADPSGGTQAVEHTYTYAAARAWHYNDDPFTPAEERTWSIWRGYRKVTDVHRRAGEHPVQDRHRLPAGHERRPVLGTDGKTADPDQPQDRRRHRPRAPPALTDSDQYAGFTREQITYNGATAVGGTVNDPWSKRTAPSTSPTPTPRRTTSAPAPATTHTYLTGAKHPGAPRTRHRPRYDAYGMAVTVEDQGDDAKQRRRDLHPHLVRPQRRHGINSLVSRTRTVGKACADRGRRARPARRLQRAPATSSPTPPPSTTTRPRWSADAEADQGRGRPGPAAPRATARDDQPSLAEDRPPPPTTPSAAR